MNKKTTPHKEIIKNTEAPKHVITPTVLNHQSTIIDCTNETKKLEDFISKSTQKFEKKVAQSKILQGLEEWKQERKSFKKLYKEFQVQYINYWIDYNAEQLKKTEAELLAKTKELEELKTDFRKFYERTQSAKPQTIIPTSTQKKPYSFRCDLSKLEISRLYDKCFKNYFICKEEDIFNLFSEQITTQISIKPRVKLIDVVSFFSALYDERIIKSAYWASTIEKTKLIIFNGKPINANQIKDAKKLIKNSYRDIEHNDLIKTALK